MTNATLLTALFAAFAIACGGGSNGAETTPTGATTDTEARTDTATDTATDTDTDTDTEAPDKATDGTASAGDGKATGVCVSGMYVEVGDIVDGKSVFGLSYPKYSDEGYAPETFGESFTVVTEGADDVLAAITQGLKTDVMLKKRADGDWDIVDEEDCPPLPEL